MPFWLSNILLPLIRWMHIVAATLLLGGTFFFEFAVPEALEDLKTEHRLGIEGRFRWIFRRVVIFCVVFTVISGVIATARLWHGLGTYYANARVWFWLHVALGVLAMGVALRLTLFGRVPAHTLAWMRFNVVLLLVVVFLATVSRHVRILSDDMVRAQSAPVHYDPMRGR